MKRMVVWELFFNALLWSLKLKKQLYISNKNRCSGVLNDWKSKDSNERETTKNSSRCMVIVWEIFPLTRPLIRNIFRFKDWKRSLKKEIKTFFLISILRRRSFTFWTEKRGKIFSSRNLLILSRKNINEEIHSFRVLNNIVLWNSKSSWEKNMNKIKTPCNYFVNSLIQLILIKKFF